MHVIVRSDKVRIPTGHGAVSCMEFGAHFMRRRYPHVVGEECVHGAAQLGRAPLVRHSYTDRLPARVNARVGTTGPLGHDSIAAQPGEHPLDFPLDSPP